VVTGAAEHHAVLDTVRALGSEGATPRVLPVDGTGNVRLADLEQQLDERVAVLSIMHSNNEVGTLAPLREIADIAHKHGVPLHTDAVQSLGKVPLNVQDLDVDLMTLTAHKLYGPKGIGALYVKRGTPLAPLLTGGGQERGKRPGTESLALAVGFAKAAELAIAAMNQESQRLRTLRDNFEERFRREFPAAQFNGNRDSRLPHISSISFSSDKIHLEGEMLIPALDLRGVALSSGSACTSGSIQPSHVLLAMGRDIATAKATMRFSFGKGNGEDHIDQVLNAVSDVVEKNLVS
jgi:cysteine desulfurase